MGLFHYKWSKTAASNATADANVNFAEGQAPSSVNDSARALMASAAGFRDDISGAIVTGGTSTAYTVTSNQIFDTLANMSGQLIAFTPHATNGATVTLNVDGLGAKPLRQSPGVELPAGVLILGSPYVALYNNSDAAWYLQNFYINPYSVPIGGSIEFWGTTAPNSSFVIPIGQAISRSTYSVLFGIVSTTYGVGDGSTTFNLPDCRGRVMAQKESSATLLTSTYFIGDSTSLGVKGGFESHTLTTAQLASHSHANTLSDSTHTHTWGPSGFQANVGATGASGTTPQYGTTTASTGNNNQAPMTINNVTAGSGNAHPNVQPTIIGNRIMRVI